MIFKIKSTIKKYLKLDDYSVLRRSQILDLKNVRRTNNIQNIPFFEHRVGGKSSYAEWAYVIGVFQTLIGLNLRKATGNKILDVGCGTGLLAIASQHYVTDGGRYLGIDVVKEHIEFCKEHYKLIGGLSFEHINTHNPMYSKNQLKSLAPWTVESETMDLVTALSVWTHLNEEDGRFYFKEIGRVLKKGGRAIITFFLLDDDYKKSIEKRENKLGRFHSTNQTKWIFDTSAYNSQNWLFPKDCTIPENAIGVTKKGLQLLIDNSGLKLVNYHIGNWKECPGIYFQDTLIFEKI